MRSLLFVSSLLAAPALAQNAQGDVSVTIYNDNLALVQDTRQMAIPSGRSRQEFPNVSGQISPETVTLNAPDVAIVEQNFDFDLLSPAKLMEKAVGEMITLVRTNPATGAEERERARVLAVNGGVVLQIGERIEVLRDDGLPIRVIFDEVPESLRARPTLSVTLESSRAGARPVTLSYLTPGMSWKADYVTLFDEAAGTIDVQGWVTLTNTTGTTFENADTLLIAGQVQQEQGPRYGRGYRPPPPPPPPPGNRPGVETAGRESLGDFYLYPLPERTTIANQQTKQVSFLDVTGAAARRAYVYRNGWLQTRDQAESADTVLQFSSSRNAGLGDALPAGTVRVYMKDARGQAQFVGENSIGHTPMGSDIAIRTGAAFDVKVQPVLVERREMPGRRWQTTMRYTLTNASPTPVTVDLIQAGLWGDTRIVEESQESNRRSADETLWRVAVPANGEASVTATFDTRF
ncbi:DUF4139 domain-containing protein [Sphingosinicella humi]|uniref:DUF4139 domain-containing protein n=1 Tax=Allosphingosinicella humi TaxID=2068657 RepID=A0A2U2J1Q3_9SPHN|nr:DUF4139 domain-containing protein [Sphingosinicella humi]PWG02263.1 DUF4139 domain-containing protein [Sphingosinicella humi]